jgi:hypothetical protein
LSSNVVQLLVAGNIDFQLSSLVGLYPSLCQSKKKNWGRKCLQWKEESVSKSTAPRFALKIRQPIAVVK